MRTVEQILGELQNFLEVHISAIENQAKKAAEDPILNVHLVGKAFAYREVRCFLEHCLKSLKEDEK